MRPEIVLFGDSLTAQSFSSGGWGAALADTYSRKVGFLFLPFICIFVQFFEVSVLVIGFLLIDRLML